MRRVLIVISLLSFNFLNANDLKTEGNLRGFFLDRPDANGLAIGLKLKASQDVNNFSLSSAIYGTQKLSNSKRLSNTLLVDGEDAYVIIGEANIKYSNDFFNIIAGRLKIETPLIGADDGRMIPNLYEGVYLNSNSIENLKLEALYLTKMSGFWSKIYSGNKISKFISMGKSAGYDGVANNSKVIGVGATYSKDNFSLSGWDYYANNLLNSFFIETSLTHNILKTSLQYAKQNQIGDTKKELESLNKTLNYEYFGAKAEIQLNKFKTTLAITDLFHQDGIWNNATHIWAGLPQYTLAQEYVLISTGTNGNGMNVYKIGFGYEFDSSNNLDLNFYKFDLSKKTSNNDVDVINLIYNYKYSNSVTLLAVYERANFNIGESGDVGKMVLNYNF